MLVRSFDELRDQSREALKRLNPAFVFYESGVDKRHVPVGWFEFKSYGLDTDVYNLMFVSRIGGRCCMVFLTVTTKMYLNGEKRRDR